jgi:alkyl hydroperoxide reductase subunit AhpC
MALSLGDMAPDFTQGSTQRMIHFHDWIAGKWAVLFSHPKDFTPAVFANDASAQQKVMAESQHACAS